MELIVKFTDQSPSFTNGVEFGRLLAKMERGERIIWNNGFPVRQENLQVIMDCCSAFGYIPTFSPCPVEGWIYFTGTKIEVSN